MATPPQLILSRLEVLEMVLESAKQASQHQETVFDRQRSSSGLEFLHKSTSLLRLHAPSPSSVHSSSSNPVAAPDASQGSSSSSSGRIALSRNPSAVSIIDDIIAMPTTLAARRQHTRNNSLSAVTASGPSNNVPGFVPTFDDGNRIRVFAPFPPARVVASTQWH